MKHTKKFTKTLALILSLLMIFTMTPISVSVGASGEATAITSAADFAAMTEDGNYYLANNISVSSTYSKVFKGTFDGRGNTIVTTAPLFKTVDGATIENLTVNGSIKGRAAVVSYVLGNTFFRNVINSASVDGSNLGMKGDYSTDVTSTDTIAGGIAGCIIGSLEDGTTVTFENCVNKASIKVTVAEKNSSVGGILGGAMFHTSFANSDVAKKATVIFKKCVNQGRIETITNAGGILGCAFGMDSVCFENCQNSGEIIADSYSGGMIASSNSTNTVCLESCNNVGKLSYRTENIKSYVGGLVGYCLNPISIVGCNNSGEIISTDGAAGIIGRAKGGATIVACFNTATIRTLPASDKGNYAGGILAYEDNSEIDISYCYNTGNITSNKYIGGIAGRINNILSDVVGCYNSGTIALNEGYMNGKIGQMFQGGNYGTLENNYYDKAQSDAGVRGYYLKGSDLDNEYGIAYETADVASGKLAYDMNKSIGGQIYYQNLTDTDAAKYPTLNANDGAVIKSGETYYSIRIETADKAAVRIDGVKTGLRVTTAVNKADYDKMIASGISTNDIIFGTVFTSAAYVNAVEAVGGVFSMANFDLYLADVENSYVDVAVAKKGTEGFYATDADAYHFRGALVNISNENLAEDFSAIGYVKLGEDIVYSGYYTTVSIAEISEMAYEDRTDAADTTYAQSIAANSEVAIGAVVTYSPYTEVQLKALKSYFN